MTSLPKGAGAAVTERSSLRHAERRRQLIERQISHGMPWLSFSPLLERDYLHDLIKLARRDRVSMLLIAGFVAMMTPLVDTTLFHITAAAATPLRWLLLGLYVPLTLAAAAVAGFNTSPKLVEYVMSAAILCMGIIICAARYLLQSHGLDFPVEFITILLVAQATLAYQRSYLALSIGTTINLIAIAIEMRFNHPDGGALYHLAAAEVLALFAAYLQLSGEYKRRRAWLNRRLLQLLSRVDSLTGLSNRAALEDELARAYAYASRGSQRCGLAVIDIDHFGAYNNHYGHVQGDVALREVASVIADHAQRATDVVGRFGGEEFIVCWVGDDGAHIVELAESLRQAVADRHLEHPRSTAGSVVTVSVGLCHIEAPDERHTLDDLLQRADAQLFEAKRLGRNRVCVQAVDIEWQPTWPIRQTAL